MIRRPPRSTLTYTLFPYTTLFRSSRHLLDALLHPRLARLPGGAAEAVEFDPLALGAEARQHLDVLHRHVELVAAVVDHLEEIVRRAGSLTGLQPLVAAEHMVHVDHEVLLVQDRKRPSLNSSHYTPLHFTYSS